MSAPEKYLNSPVAKNPEPMTVLFYFPDQNTSASCEIAGSVFDALKAGAARDGISLGAFISQAVALKTQPPKTAKGFFMVNLASWQQKELRELARESGCELRGALGWALTIVRERLFEMVKIQRQTGKTLRELKLDGAECRYRSN